MSGIALQSTETRLFRIVAAIMQLAQGRSDAVGNVTLTPGATATVVKAVNCGKDSRIFLTPQTANAAAALAYVQAADVGLGSFTITHDSNAATDRTFSWGAFG
jgi:hypothetical protein